MMISLKNAGSKLRKSQLISESDSAVCILIGIIQTEFSELSVPVFLIRAMGKIEGRLLLFFSLGVVKPREKDQQRHYVVLLCQILSIKSLCTHTLARSNAASCGIICYLI